MSIQTDTLPPKRAAEDPGYTFHPAVAAWFQKTFSSATEIQAKAWPAIQQKKQVLISAPTGSGKTLAGFLATIDELVRRGVDGTLPDKTLVVYVSPLKALSNDIEKNLQEPLAGIRNELEAFGLADIQLRVQVRTGDTPAKDRAAMLREPPHILVTTPESLYLLLTSPKGREMLSEVGTLLVDEIHALLRDKRGSHFALTMERLDALVRRPVNRIGISATQKPIETVAAFLLGSRFAETGCEIINTGHKRNLELSIEVPRSPLGAVMANEVWGEIYDRIVSLIEEHRTTLIFVNNRRLAERMAHLLTERLGKDQVTAHHGSMSREHRQNAEERLKAGSLRALVATASLELGIDIGSVDLVCQISSPRGIATFLQRIGRSGHTVKGTPKGKLFPLTRDELVECAALLDAVKRGELDQLILPEKPIDILAQQIVAEIATGEKSESAVYEMFRRAYPYRNLSREEFDEVVGMLSEGFTTRRGRRGAYLFHDTVSEVLKPRKNARLVAIMSGGAIPDTFDYEVRLEPTNTFIGTLHEDFSIESSAGDIFQLGNHSWMITRVENGVVRVVDAGQAPPTIPFWLGEAPGRTAELSFAVGRFRDEFVARLPAGFIQALSQGNEDGDLGPDRELALENEFHWKESSIKWLVTELGLAAAAAEQITVYLAASYAALRAMPSQETLVLERFFDEAGDQHLVIHSPFGNRMNRAWGLSIRKRFCRKFNFELQAAATDDAIVLSLGATHSFPLDEVFHYLHSNTVRDILIQAVFDSPMFEVRWRWNATRALAVPRRREGKKVPAQIQRMAAQDLVALVFPDQLACLENIAGDREIPDHPLVRQTIEDCLTEAMDLATFETLLKKIEAKELTLVARDLREPSLLSQEILNARPYAFLDDAPLEERRTRAISGRRFMEPSEASELGRLDPLAIKLVREEVWPEAETPDELHDALVLLGFLTVNEVAASWKPLFSELARAGRATELSIGATRLFVPVERLPQFLTTFPDLVQNPVLTIPEKIAKQVWTRETAIVEILRGRLEGLGPVTAESLAESSALPLSEVNLALLSLENEGFIFRGNFSSPEASEWCERRLLKRIHRHTLEKLRKEIEPVSAADFMSYLFSWQRLTEKLEGPQSLDGILEQLEGYEAPASSWESVIFPARISDYDFEWLDRACLSGKTAWGRFHAPKKSSGGSPVKSSPIMLVSRSRLDFWKNLFEGPEEVTGHLSPSAKKVFETLEAKGASFHYDLEGQTGLLKSQVEEALGELVAKGLANSDSFTGLRALLVPGKYKSSAQKQRHRRSNLFNMDLAGRWSLLNRNHSTENKNASEETADSLARIFLKRYGIVFRKITENEGVAPPWRDLVRIYRRMEARGEIRGGRFVEGIWGEQFALPEALVKLRQVRREKNREGASEDLLAVSAVDPANLHGILTPGAKPKRHSKNGVLFRSGVPVAAWEDGEMTTLAEASDEEKWKWRNLLARKTFSAKLRPHLGKGIG